LADTEAIRALGTANAALADDLANVARILSSMPADSALGPVGDRFMSALAGAAVDGSRAVSTLGESLAASGSTAHTAAAAYDQADHGVRSRIAEV
ncbi:MAG: hypothetical protein QOD39_1164, partial [Mycobacterium sp.]|nr:hypothetical protein [Mycobacterium sp.]